MQVQGRDYYIQMGAGAIRTEMEFPAPGGCGYKFTSSSIMIFK